MHESVGSIGVRALPTTAEPVQPLRYTRSYPGRQDQVRQVRAFLREVLTRCPRADDAVAVGSEFAANACLHSRSGVPGGVFTVHAEVSESDYLYVAVRDDGGAGDSLAAAVIPGHGLDLVQAIAGPGNWGIGTVEAGHLAWARLPWPGTSRLHTPSADVPGQPADDAAIQADLQKLAAELTTVGLGAQLVTTHGELSCLEVRDLRRPVPPVRVHAQADWYFWPTAERIAARDDASTAAAAITRILRPAAIAPTLPAERNHPS